MLVHEMYLDTKCSYQKYLPIGTKYRIVKTLNCQIMLDWEMFRKNLCLILSYTWKSLKNGLFYSKRVFPSLLILL